tara:strand:+ start:13356 stop:13997 length:642 start_codon:yes stop_codon:yes gene_type:complete
MKDKNTIGIYKYRSCNIESLKNALNIIESSYQVSENFNDLSKFTKIIIPGVGNMKNIHQDEIKDLSKEIFSYCQNGGLIYGICLGLQMLFDYSEESEMKTLGLLKGNTISVRKKFEINLNVNFNNLNFEKKHYENHMINSLFKDIDKDSNFYFLHSYYCDCSDQDCIIINSSVKNSLMPSMFVKKNILGTQFHPELSKTVGIKFLKNFSNLNI